MNDSRHPWRVLEVPWPLIDYALMNPMERRAFWYRHGVAL